MTLDPTDMRGLPVSRRHPARRIEVGHGDTQLVLRPTLVTDAEAIAGAIEASLPELRRFMPWAHRAQPALTQLERLRCTEADYFAGRDFSMGLFAARSDGSHELVAMVGLHARVPLNPVALEVGYWVPTPVAGRGWATLAVRLVTTYAFDKLGADRVQVMCDEANVASRRVIEKCGFELEGVLRRVTEAPSAALLAAGYADTGRHPMYAMLADAFAAQPWAASTRASMTYVNLAGYTVDP